MMELFELCLKNLKKAIGQRGLLVQNNKNKLFDMAKLKETVFKTKPN